MHIQSDVPNRIQSLDAISDFEDTFLNLYKDPSLQVVQVYTLANMLREKLELIRSHNVFCSTPPILMAPLKNKTHSIGQTLSLVCNTTAEPNPNFIWYKNEDHIDGQVEMELVISELTENDTGWYNCMAGNLVANLTFMLPLSM